MHAAQTAVKRGVANAVCFLCLQTHAKAGTNLCSVYVIILEWHDNSLLPSKANNTAFLEHFFYSKPCNGSLMFPLYL